MISRLDFVGASLGNQGPSFWKTLAGGIAFILDENTLGDRVAPAAALQLWALLLSLVAARCDSGKPA